MASAAAYQYPFCALLGTSQGGPCDDYFCDFRGRGVACAAAAVLGRLAEAAGAVCVHGTAEGLANARGRHQGMMQGSSSTSSVFVCTAHLSGTQFD